MTVVSLDLTHTCSADGRRKRNYSTKDISDVSNLLGVYVPTETKEGNTKQFIQMTKRATGFSMKNGQANLAIRSKSNDTLEAHIGQCMLLPSLFEAHELNDPAGTFVVEDTACYWDRTLRQFHRAYFALSIAKHFWKEALITMTVCDGTFTKCRNFKHSILIAVTFDGNNQVIILAMAIVEVEDADNWVWFKERIDEDFPGYNVWMSDKDKGIRSNAFSQALSLSQQQGHEIVLSRCVRHLSDNCKDACESGPMNDDHKLMIKQLAESRTEDVYKKRLEEIAKKNKPWSEWLDARKKEFVAYHFLQQGHNRFGKTSSNGVENTNGVLLPARGKPILEMIEDMVSYQLERYSERQQGAQQWMAANRSITPFAEAMELQTARKASRRTVVILHRHHPVHKARVSVGNNSGNIEVTVNVETKTSTCQCLYKEEHGLNCYHVKALLLRLGELGVGEAWINKRFHVRTCTKSFSLDIPGMCTAGLLHADETVVPPDHKQSAGRPPKRRKQKQPSGRPRQCKACGEFGHFAIKCEKPSTQFRFENNKERALQWCKTKEIILLDE